MCDLVEGVLKQGSPRYIFSLFYMLMATIGLRNQERPGSGVQRTVYSPKTYPSPDFMRPAWATLS